MKTIVIDIRLIGKGRTGDEMVFRSLTQEIVALDRENQYLLLTDETDRGKLARLYHELGIVGKENVEIISLVGRNRFVWNLFAVPFFLLRQHADVFHTQYILPIFVPSHTRVIVHIHDVSFRALPWFVDWKDRLMLHFFIPRSLKRADAIVVPSQFTRDEISRYFSSVQSEKIHVVPNACSQEFKKEASQEEVLAAQKKYQLPERYIVVVGTLQPRKNLPFLIRAFAELQKRDTDIKLVLVGNRSAHHFDQGIDHVIAELNLGQQVIFPGFVAQNDLPAVIRGAILYAFPSLYEGFGIPLLEAMSQGTPMAVSDVPCLREVAGDAALYFDPSRVDVCAEILYTLTIHSDQRKQIIEAGKNRFDEFSWSKSAQLLAAIYYA
ncbi:MAG: glycosyltransferase family 4 protein [Candidatus Moranbacteria bacterium]|jgi:glycosyltransferase involved in cell wall biosynthesis|nr:glycosyltransferase family 4 protein [Candidatus Moranbacteria bacterium]MBP9801623.1 glycosyltransferase family 4 protein [Candidatus Moranbacteria bacterium]